ESHKTARAAPRVRTASPLGFRHDRGAGRPSFAGKGDRSDRPTLHVAGRRRRRPRFAEDALSSRLARLAQRPLAGVADGSGATCPVIHLRGVDEMKTERTLSGAWDQHLASEFAEKSADQALATMTAEPHVNVVPLMIGARGRTELHDFYANHFL